MLSFFSMETYVEGIQKNRLTETVLLSNPEQMLKLMDNKMFTFSCSKVLFSLTYDTDMFHFVCISVSNKCK